MKKLVALLMALALMASFAACNSKKENNSETNKAQGTQTPGETTGDETEQIPDESTGDNALTPEEILGQTPDAGASEEETVEDPEELQPGMDTTAVDMLQDVWASIDASQKPSIIGGHFSDPSDQPAKYPLDYAKDLQSVLMIPDIQIDYVIDAATAVHMLNANIMTVGIVRISEGNDVQLFVENVRDCIKNHEWTCGIPESMYVASVRGGFVVIAYGSADMLAKLAAPLAADWAAAEIYNEAVV